MDDSDREFEYELDDAEDDAHEDYDDIADDDEEDDDEEDDDDLPPSLSELLRSDENALPMPPVPIQVSPSGVSSSSLAAAIASIVEQHTANVNINMPSLSVPPHVGPPHHAHILSRTLSQDLTPEDLDSLRMLLLDASLPLSSAHRSHHASPFHHGRVTHSVRTPFPTLHMSRPLFPMHRSPFSTSPSSAIFPLTLPGNPHTAVQNFAHPHLSPPSPNPHAIDLFSSLVHPRRSLPTAVDARTVTALLIAANPNGLPIGPGPALATPSIGAANPVSASNLGFVSGMNSVSNTPSATATALDAVHLVMSAGTHASNLSSQNEHGQEILNEAATTHPPSSSVPVLPQSSRNFSPDFVPSSVPRARDGTPLHDLLNADLMRTIAIPVRSEGPLTALAGSRPSFATSMRDSERSRDKVPPALARRWQYEPALSGGDSLPPILDCNSGMSRHSKSSSSRDQGQASSSTPVPKHLTQAASKITSVIEQMVYRISGINDKLRLAEKRVEEEKKRKEEARIKEAEKKKEEEKAGEENASKLEGDGDEPKMSDVETTDPPNGNNTNNPSTNINAGTIPENSEMEREGPSDGDADEDRNDSAGVSSDSEIAAAIAASLAAAPDEEAQVAHNPTESRTDDDEQQPQQMETEDPENTSQENAATNMESRDGSNIVSSASATPASNVTSSNQNDQSNTAAASSGNQFSAVATERAAAAGISLDAPANENPEVVAAATESTGIDPAFLAALPADVREEILTDYYRRIIDISNGNNGGPGASASNPATSVNQDFLIALPPSLRAEVLELEADFQARRGNSNANNQSGADGAGDNNDNPVNNGIAAEDMDPATFLATLSPDLREDILLESGEEFIESLPPNVVAEARVLREREMSTRLPWRVSDPYEPYGSTPGRDGRGGGRSGGVRGGERAPPREPPAYKWKQVEAGWLRERPNPANEPTALLKADGIAALVGLLWARNGFYTRDSLYRVLLNTCKTTELRYTILDRLLSLITSRPDEAISRGGQDSVVKREGGADAERMRFHGTAVRRGLDMLTILCKNEVLVSETLLGLPKTEEELSKIGEVSLTDSGELMTSPNNERKINLSTLMSLLRDRLFMRSVSHLEQLVVIILAVAQAIPSKEVKAQEKGRGRRSHRGGQSFFLPPPVVAAAGENSLNVIYDDDTAGNGNGSGPGAGVVFHGRDDEDNEYHDHEPYRPSWGNPRLFTTVIYPQNNASANEGTRYNTIGNNSGAEAHAAPNTAAPTTATPVTNSAGDANNTPTTANANETDATASTTPATATAPTSAPAPGNAPSVVPATAPSTVPSTANTGGDAKVDVKASKPEKTIVPVKYRIPIIQKADLVALTQVLLREGCSERTYDRASKAIGLLGELPDNRIVFMRSLVSIAHDAGQKIWTEYERYIHPKSIITDTDKSKQKVQASPRVTNGIDSAFVLGSAKNELTLLRVVKSLSTLMKHNRTQSKTKMKKDETAAKVMPLTPSTLQEEHFRHSVVHGLQELWTSLDQLLERVSDDVKGAGKKDSDSSSRTPTTPGAAASGVPLPSPTSLPMPSSGLRRAVRTYPRSAAAVINGDRLKVGSGGLSPTLARLSPMIEAFLVTHCSEEEGEDGNTKSDDPNTSAGQLARSSGSIGSPMASSAAVGSIASSSSSSSRGRFREIVSEGKPLDERVALFVESHRGAINALLRANPSLLEKSFKGVLRHAHAIDFDNKKAYFRNVLRRRSSEAHARPIRINVRRERVFDDSYQQLRMRTPDEMKGRLHVQFSGEEGVDAGGVTREWYTILARQIFDPNYVLFTRSAAKSATYQPDKRSYINLEHLDNFRFVGRIIGKAIYDGQLLDAYFTRSFYKHILGLKPTYHDIEAQDPEYYKSLKWMLENNIDGVFDYTMSAEYDEFGKQTVVDLMPDGRNIPVTEENKADYVRLVTEVRMTKTIEKQIQAFKQGFYELIPYEDCKIFNELELELLMSGLPDIDVADLKANVEYTGYTASSPQINWFWKCVSTMDQEDLARLVMFVTGTSKVPLEGFAQLQGMNGIQKFQIHRVSGNSMRLPSAHTCFNQLDLPEYSSAEVLEERLLRAVRECSVGFGFA